VVVTEEEENLSQIFPKIGSKNSESNSRVNRIQVIGTRVWEMEFQILLKALAAMHLHRIQTLMERKLAALLNITQRQALLKRRADWLTCQQIKLRSIIKIILMDKSEKTTRQLNLKHLRMHLNRARKKPMLDKKYKSDMNCYLKK